MGSSSQQAVIWGAAGHALVVADILRLQGGYELVGFLDSVNLQRTGETFGGASVLGGEDKLQNLLAQGVTHIALAIGDCAARLQLAEKAIELGFELITAIHPAAVIARDVHIGPGSVICAGAVVNPATQLGRVVIINTCASVDHECQLQDGVHVSPGAHLAGRVVVGRATSIGVGSAIRDGITIGEGCIIGAGSVVVKDIPANVTAYGVPARAVSQNSLDTGL